MNWWFIEKLPLQAGVRSVTNRNPSPMKVIPAQRSIQRRFFRKIAETWSRLKSVATHANQTIAIMNMEATQASPR